ncbi:response regulator [Pedobacter ghigonis]|uniref:hypothetical protein n=1 Tax=Pedobacter ghigonis TaxID=2730403 RepID=UPI00158B3F09|nr:hypothetical protein [Pedobacter ghigonis]
MTANRDKDKMTHTSIDVLIICREVAGQKELTNCLSEFDVSFKVVTSENTALLNLNDCIFKLVMADVEILESGEFNLLHKIRQNLLLNIPVVAILPHHAEALQAKCFNAGISGCFTRPISKIEVMGILTQFLSKETDLINGDRRKTEFEMIDLTYLKEVSMGDAGFEQEMATKFIAIIADDLKALKEALAASNYKQLRRVAHQMLTTISVMGLGSKISSNLRSIEFDDLSEEQLSQQVQFVSAICTKAKEEVLTFLKT